jgi:hypothetical protein
MPAWVAVAGLLLAACRRGGSTSANGTPVDDAAIVGALVAAEETYLSLGPKMSLLSKGLMDLQLPGPGADGIFAPRVNVTDVGPPPSIPPHGSGGAAAIESRTWPVAEGEIESDGRPGLWRPVLDAVSWFEHAKVYHIRGEHPAGDERRFEADAGFEALAFMKSGEWRSFNGKMKLTWQRMEAGAAEPEPDWRITEWHTTGMNFASSPKRLFVEALDTAIPSASEVARLRRSQHYEATVKFYLEGRKSPPHPYFSTISANHKEGVSVADIDGDGFEDIYITVRIGKNMLLRNRGDGTFVEEAHLHGLDLPGHTTCSIFADFDNDGDLDVMLGRSLLKTTYLENEAGWFIQKKAPAHYPMAVISMSAADYNRDGLLDVYLCTYRAAAPSASSPAGGVAESKGDSFDWQDEFLSPGQAAEYRRRVAEQKESRRGHDDQFPELLDQVGPPNVLLVNRGRGRFDVAPENNIVGLWRNSLQATWGDYDRDGDPDLYVANDWAPDNLLRNDGRNGFADVTVEAGITSYGFAMGASWGDYDNDGREDMYVSNMFSKAGRRILARVPGVSKSLVESAAGNWLYHHESNGKFTQVAGLDPPAMTVMKAGWSWGGMFSDFDNDGYLDLYVLSGYFTAPKALSSELDL